MLAQPATKAAVLQEIVALMEEASDYGRMYKRQWGGSYPLGSADARRW